MPSIHAEVLEGQEDCRNWAEFEGRLLERYGSDDLLRLTKKEFMDWVKRPVKGLNMSALLQEFEKLVHNSRH